jgi:hypothetical protein
MAVVRRRRRTIETAAPERVAAGGCSCSRAAARWPPWLWLLAQSRDCPGNRHDAAGRESSEPPSVGVGGWPQSF